MSGATVCVVVPTYDNAATIAAVVDGVRRHLSEVIVVDDGSGNAGRLAVEELARRGLARVVRRDRNGGKGAAVKDGLRLAQRLGFTHALQIDADGQHDTDDVPRLLEASRSSPDALVLAAPEFDATAPRSRVIGRRVSAFWVGLEIGGEVAIDPLCGFRVYPVGPACSAGAASNRMDFDPEIIVRLAWAGVPIVTVPTRVRYLSPDQGGVSHYRLVRDNLAMSLLHARLVNAAILRGLRRRMGGRPS